MIDMKSILAGIEVGAEVRIWTPAETFTGGFGYIKDSEVCAVDGVYVRVSAITAVAVVPARKPRPAPSNGEPR